MYRILLVDDEQNVLNALRRELQGDFEIEMFNDPRLALQRCRETTFDLVLADYKMPEMNGVEFLRQFGELQPDAARLMLSGQADFSALTNTINQVHIFRFLAKPWDQAELAATLAEALHHREQMLENRRLAQTVRMQRPWQQAHDPGRKYQVLIVDDEPNVLHALARDLNARGGFDDLHMALLQQADPALPLEHRDLHFHVTALTSPVEALERARQVNFDAVISDYLMPEMDGLRFLASFREIQPEAARILLSGHADKEVLVKAINNSEIYSYVSKPWNEYALKSALSQAIAYHDLLREYRLLSTQTAH